MVQVIEQFDPFGKLGEGLGKGLQEGMTQGAQNARLSAGLDRLKNMPAGSQPLDWMQTLAKSSVTPDQMQMIMPLVTQQMKLQALTKPQSAGGATAGTAQPGQAPGAIPVSAPGRAEPPKMEPTSKFEKEYGYKPESLEVPSDITAQIGERPVYSPEQKIEIARQAAANPALGITTQQEAMAYADTVEKSAQDKYDAKKSAGSDVVQLSADFDALYKQQLQQKLQKDEQGVWGEISGEYEPRFIKPYQQQVRRGEITPKAAAERAALEALDFAKARIGLQKLGYAGNNYFGPPTDQQLKNYSAIRETYAKHGLLDRFSDDLQLYNDLSPALANQIAKPMNKEMYDSFKELPTKYVSGKGYPTKGSVNEKQHEAAIKKWVSDNVNNLKTSDSLFSIAKDIHDIGGNENEWWDAINKAKDSGQLELTARQHDELKNRQPIEVTLGDLFFTSGSTIPFGTKLKRLFFGR